MAKSGINSKWNSNISSKQTSFEYIKEIILKNKEGSNQDFTEIPGKKAIYKHRKMRVDMKMNIKDTVVLNKR
jgi:hypothetical protein